MKRKLIWFVLILLLSHGAVMAQMEMQVTLTRASAAPFPTSAMAYYNNPMNYFNLTITPVDGRAHDVFISMSISSDATTTRIWTDERFVGTMPKISIPSLGKRIGSVEFVQHFNRRLNTNLSESYRGVSDLTLPEGTYHICIDVHDYYDTASVIGHSCLDFDICYSGLAPELTSPYLTASSSGGYDKLIPTKKTNFSWTGVVSNCFEPNAFNYVIQFVAVYPGQNVQEAVESNPVLAALDCGRRTFFTYDYQTNPYLRLDSGGVYAVMVEAVPSDADRVVNLDNDGKSQYMVFVWCGPNTSGIGSSGSASSGGGGAGSTTGNGDGVSDIKMTMRDNQSAVLRTLKKPNIVYPRPFSTIDDINNPLNIVASPVSGDSVSSSDYMISLYEYVGDTSISMSRPPLKQATLTNVTAHDGNPLTMVSDWSDNLVAGTQYLVSIKSNAAYRYNNIYRVRRVDFIDRFPEINRYDSIVSVTGHADMTSIVVFQWGTNTDDYNVLSPSQILTIGRKTCEGECVRVNKSDLHTIVWKDALFDGNRSDLVVYDVFVQDAEGAGGIMYEKTGISETNMDADEMVSRLATGHTYSICVRARLYYDTVGFVNGVDSRVVKFIILASSSESSYNSYEQQLPMFRLKEGSLFDADEEAYHMKGRTAMSSVYAAYSPDVAKSSPDSVVVNYSTGGVNAHGNPNKISIYRGFKSDRLVNSANGNVTKATVSAQLDMFTIDGVLSQLPSGGWGGPAKVTVMDGVSAIMYVGFGTARDNNGHSFDWWYIYGGEQYDKPLAVGAMDVAGFGGVFAHNMTISDAAFLSKTPKDLVSGSYDGVRFAPKKNSWVAKGGIRMSLENKHLLDAYGTIVLARENGHFSRLFVDMGGGKLSESNPLMDNTVQNIFAYEVTSEYHWLHLVQLPIGVKCEFKYNGIDGNGSVANVGFGLNEPTLKATAMSVDKSGFCKPFPVSIFIETWRSGGQSRWCAKLGGRYGSALELGNGLMLRDVCQLAGNRDQIDTYKFDKSLLSALPSAAKSEAMQSKAVTVALARLERSSAVGTLEMSGTMETDLSRQSDKVESNDALLTCLLGTRVNFAGWHGNVDLAQSVIPAEVSLDSGYRATGITPLSVMPIATKRRTFSFFNEIEFTEADANTGEVSPFAKCFFRTAVPVSYIEQDGSPRLNDILVADADNEPRRFCLSLGSRSKTSLGMKYSYNDCQTGRIAAEGQGGGFASDKRNVYNLVANMYEKRYASRSVNDRQIDIYTGDDVAAMKSNEIGWGLPLCGGTPSRTTTERILNVVAHKAPYTLSNQVLFTWPYNGDPFVPNEEIDSACYIFFKYDRDDLFDGYSLKRDGKLLRVFAVNQELGDSKAIECRFFYFPSALAGKDAVPYVKVYIPKALFKTKNDAGTYSPCHVSLMVVDTAEYASAYKECKSKAVYSGVTLSDYSVCRQVGTRVYDLYFRLDHMYATYKMLMQTISDESDKCGVGIGFGADNVTVDPSNAVITSKLSSINLNRYFAFRNRSYLFDSYKPNDPSLYATDVTLPPIAMMAVNGRESIDDYYNAMIPEWLAVNESFYYQYAHLLHYQQRAKWLTIDKFTVPYNTDVRITNLSMLAPASMRVSQSNGMYVSMNDSELTNIFASGNAVNRNTLSAMQSSWRHEGVQTRPPCEWNTPALIQVSSDLLNRVNESHFSSTAHIKSVAFVKANPVICIQDRVSPCVMKENKVFASFFTQLRGYAEWFAGLDEKERGVVRESITEYDRQHNQLPQVENVYLTMDDTPFAIPKASLIAAYDSWSSVSARFISRDYWFDNWTRSNATESYQGIKPAWSSPWIESNYCPANTEQYRQANRRKEYRQYVVNPYYLSLNGGEESFLNTIFGICRDVIGKESIHPQLHHNVASDVRIAIHIPYNKVVKNYLSINK